MFRGKAWKWLLMGSAFTIIMLYMLELTTTGIERVYGPMAPIETTTLQPNMAYEGSTEELAKPVEEQAALPPIDPSLSPIDKEIATLEYEIAQLKKQALEKEKQQLQSQLLLNESVNEPAVNRLADTTSSVLQEASTSSMQYIAQLFSKVIN